MARKRNCSKTKKGKREKKDENVYNKGKRRKNSKNKMQIPRGGVTRPPSQFESYSLPLAPNHTQGEVIRPPSQIENNSYSVIRTIVSRRDYVRTHDLDDLSCTRCAPTIAARPSRNCMLH